MLVYLVPCLLLPLASSIRILPQLRDLELPDLQIPDFQIPDIDLPDLDTLEFGAKATVYNCRRDEQCATCPDSVKHLTWTSMSLFGSTLFNRTRIECAKDCSGSIECRDHFLGRHCACVPDNLCLRGAECSSCEEDEVTTVLGHRFCCQGCRKSSVSISVDPPYVLLPTCVCNAP